jgi:hypothetical protein
VRGAGGTPRIEAAWELSSRECEAASLRWIIDSRSAACADLAAGWEVCSAASTEICVHHQPQSELDTSRPHRSTRQVAGAAPTVADMTLAPARCLSSALEMKAMEHAMNDRSQHDAGQDDEHEAAKQRVASRQPLPERRVNAIDRSHTAQEHRWVQKRVRPRQLFGPNGRWPCRLRAWRSEAEVWPRRAGPYDRPHATDAVPWNGQRGPRGLLIGQCGRGA